MTQAGVSAAVDDVGAIVARILRSDATATLRPACVDGAPQFGDLVLSVFYDEPHEFTPEAAAMAIVRSIRRHKLQTFRTLELPRSVDAARFDCDVVSIRACNVFDIRRGATRLFIDVAGRR